MTAKSVKSQVEISLKKQSEVSPAEQLNVANASPVDLALPVKARRLKKKLGAETVGDDVEMGSPVNGEIAIDSVLADVDVSVLKDGGEWVVAQLGSGVVGGLVDGAGAVAGAGAGAAAGAGTAAAAGAAAAGAAAGAGAAGVAAAGLGVGVGAAAAGAGGLALAAGGGGSSAAPADTVAPTGTTGSILHDSVNDTGVSSVDNITSNARPVISGNAEAGATVKVVVGGQTLTTTADANGHYSVTPTTALSVGSYTPAITVTDAAGNSSTTDGIAFTVGVALIAPTITLVSGDDKVNDSENTAGVTISGTAAAGSIVKIYDGASLIGTTTADGSGNYSVTGVHFEATPGATHNLTATATNNVGPSAASSIHAVMVDTTSPVSATGAILHNAGNDTGSLATDSITANTTPVIAGTAETGATVTVVVGGQTLTTTAVAGQYSVTPTTALSVGSYTPSITVTDVAGNSSTTDGTQFTVGVALSAPTIALVSGDDRVNLAENTAGVTISGTAAAGSTVKIYDGASLIGTTTADGSGNYSVTGVHFEATPGATHNLTATATNNVGPSAASSIHAVMVDTTVPTGISGAIKHDAANDTGASSSDSFTANTTPEITGTAETGSIVTVVVGAQTLTTVAVAGHYSVTPTVALGLNTYTPIITVTDAAGNTSDPFTGTPFTVGVSLGAPTIALVSGDDRVNKEENKAGVTISGAAFANSTVSIYDGGVLIGSTTADGAGAYNLTGIDFATSSGATHNLTAIASSNVGPSVASGIHVVTVDTVEPTGVTGYIRHDAPNDTGVLTTDSITANTRPVITGAAETGATVSVFVAGQTLTTVAVAGQYSVTPIGALGVGSYTPSITVTDAAGNSTTTDGMPFTVGIALSAPTIALVSGNDLINGAENTAGVTISGAAAAGSTVKVYDAGNLIGSTTADDTGSYSLTGVHFATSTGVTHSLTATATNNVGPSPFSSTHTVTVDTVAPTGTNGAIQQDAYNNTGALATDGITANNMPVITGTAETGATVTVLVGGQTLTTVAVAGHYAVTPLAALSDGNHTVSITVTDAAGNSQTVPGATITVDTIAPADATGAITHASDTAGISNTDNITSNNTPEITGTAEAGATVTVLVGGQTLTTTADVTNHFSVTPDALGEGVYDISVTVTDAAGNSSTTNGTRFEVAMPPADTTVELLATNNTEVHPAALISGHADIQEDRGERLTIEFLGVVYEEGVNLDGVILTVENNGDWTLDVSAQVMGMPDGHYDVTAIATDVAGNVTTNVVTDAIWLVNECQQFIGGDVGIDKHWDVTTDQSLAVDFGAHVAVLGGVEVVNFANSSFTFGADDVTMAECGIDVTNGDASFTFANNITLDGVNISATDPQQQYNNADESLFLATGVTLSAGGSITMLAHGVDGGVNPTIPLNNEGGLVTLTQSHIIANMWFDDAGELVAENSGIHLEAGGDILIAAEGHVNAGVTLTQSYLGGEYVALGEDVNVRVARAHIDLMAMGSDSASNSTISLFDQYTEIESSGTYTLNNDFNITYPTYESTISGFEGLNVDLYQDHLYARDLVDASDASIHITGTGTVDFISPDINPLMPTGDGVLAGNVTLVQEAMIGGSIDLNNANIEIAGSFVTLIDSMVTSHSSEIVNGFNQSHDSTHWSAGDVGIFQTDLTADNGVVNASNAGISVGGFGVNIGDVGIEQTYISATDGIDLSGANVGVWSQFRLETGTVNINHDRTATSSSNYSDRLTTNDWEIQSSDVYVVQQELTAYQGDINASDVHVSQWSVVQESLLPLVNDLYVEQNNITALDGSVFLSNVTASEFNVFTSHVVGAEVVNFAQASFSDSTFYSSEFHSTNSDVYTETATSSSAYGAQVYVSQDNIYATGGGIDAHDVLALKVEIYGATYYDSTAPVFSGDVFVEQKELHAIGVDAQGININNARAGISSTDVLAMVSHTAHDYTFAHDITMSTLFPLGSTTIENDYTYYFDEIDFASVYVSQTEITADHGTISGVNASVGIFADSVIASNIYIDQINITAYDGDLNLAGASLTITAQNSISLVDHYRTEFERDYYSTYLNTTFHGIYGNNPAVNTFDTTLASVGISQYALFAGGDLNMLDANVDVSAGSLISLHEAYLVQTQDTADGAIIAHNAGVTLAVGNDSVIDVENEVYVFQAGLLAQHQIDLADAHVTVSAGSNSYISADNVYVQQVGITAGGDIDMFGGRVVVSAGDGGEVYVPGAVYVEQNGISAGGHIDASGAQVGITVGSDDVNANAASIYTDGAYVSQDHLTAESWMHLDDAGVNVIAGNGAQIDLDGSAYISQTDNYAGHQSALNANNAHVTVAAWDHADITAYDVFIEQNHLYAGYVNINEATVEVSVGDGGTITLMGNDTIDGSVYIAQTAITAYDGNIEATDAQVTLAGGDDSYLTADTVYVTQTDMTATDNIRLFYAHVDVSAGDNGVIDVPGTVFIEQNDISAGDYLNLMGAQVDISVGSQQGTGFATIYTDGAYVSQDCLNADFVEIDYVGVNVVGGSGAELEIDGSAYVSQRDIYAHPGINGSGIFGSNVNVQVAAGDNGYVTADNVFIAQHNMTAGDTVDLYAASVDVSVGDGGEITLNGSAFIDQYAITASSYTLDAHDVSVNVEAGDNSNLHLYAAYISQTDLTADDGVDISAVAVNVQVGDGGDITLDDGALISQLDIRAVSGSVDGQDASVRITGGSDSLITIDSTVVHNNYNPTFPSYYHAQYLDWVNIPNNGWGYNTVWNDTNTRYEGTNVFIDQTQITAFDGVNLAGASVVIGVDSVTPNIAPLPSNLNINLGGVAVTIDQSNITAEHMDVDLSYAHIDLQAGNQSSINITPQTTQDGTDHYISRSDWTDLGNNDWFYNYVTRDTVWNTTAAFNDVGVSQFDVTAYDNLFANDVLVKIAAGDDSLITLDATSVRIEQFALDAVTGAIEVAGATVSIEIGKNSRLNMTPERDGFESNDWLRSFHEYIDVGNYHNYVDSYIYNRTVQQNSYGDVAIMQSDMAAASSLNVEGANIQILESSHSTIDVKGISVDINQSNLLAGSGDLNASHAVVNIHAGDFSGVTFVASAEWNYTLSSTYDHQNWSYGNAAWGSGTVTSILSDQEFSLRVEQDHLTATNGDVSVTSATVNIVVGSDSEIYLHGADVFVAQQNLDANGGNVDLGSSTIELSGGANSIIQIEQGMSTLWEQHETGWFQSWSDPRTVSTSAYAADVYIDQSYITAYEFLSGDAHDITVGGDVYMSDVAITLSVGDANNLYDGWVSAHNVYINQTDITADENITATHVGVSIQAGDHAFVEIRNANVIQRNLQAGEVLTSKLVNDYYRAPLTDDYGNSDLPIAYWGSMDLSGAYVNLAAGDVITGNEAIIVQESLWAGTTIDLSNATINLTGDDVFVSQVLIAQNDITAGGVIYAYDELFHGTNVSGYSRYQLDQMNTLSLIDPLVNLTTVLGLVDLADASIDISASGNYRGDVIVIERNNIESGLLIDMHNNRIDVTAADMTVGDVHNWLGLGGYDSGSYDARLQGVKAATFDFTGNEIVLAALDGDIAVNRFVSEWRYVTASTVNADDNLVSLTATGNINVGSGVNIGNNVDAAFYRVPVEVNMSHNTINIVADGSASVNDVYIGVGSDSSTLDLTMDNNNIYISADNVTGGYISNVAVSGQLADGSSVNNNSLEVYADVNQGDIRFSSVHLSGTDASLILWGNDVSVGSMTVENINSSDITIEAQYLTMSAGTNLTIDLIDLSSQGVADYPTPAKDHWWQSNATIASDYSLTINKLELDGAQAFLEFNVSAPRPTIHYDITLDQLGIGQNNGDLSYYLNGNFHSGSDMYEFANPLDHIVHSASTSAEQFDLIDLSDLGITSVDQLQYSISLDSDRFAGGVVDNIHFSLKTSAIGSTYLHSGSTVEFDLKNVQLLGSARHDFYAENGHQGAVGQVDEYDVWYAFWNYSLHLNSAPNPT